jgi:hypothetical protein
MTRQCAQRLRFTVSIETFAVARANAYSYSTATCIVMHTPANVSRMLERTELDNDTATGVAGSARVTARLAYGRAGAVGSCFA